MAYSGFYRFIGTVFATLHALLFVYGSDSGREEVENLSGLESNDLTKAPELKGWDSVLFLLFNSSLGCLLLYLLVKFTTSDSGKLSEHLREALERKESEASKMELETKAMMDELEELEKKLEKKEKEEEDMNFEKDELKIKMEEVLKERGELERMSEKLEKKLKEDITRLEELKEKWNLLAQENKSLKEELSRAKRDKKLLEEDVSKKESELVRPREAVLTEKHKKLAADYSALAKGKDELSEKLESLTKKLDELTSEKRRLENESQESLEFLDRLMEENERMEAIVKSAKDFEEKLVGKDSVDGLKGAEDNEEEAKVKEFVDKTAAQRKLKSGEEEFDLVRHALESERRGIRLVKAQVEKARSALEQLREEWKSADKSSRTSSIKLEVLKSHFEEREEELTSKLSKLEERDYQVLDDCLLKEKINQHMQLIHRYRTDAEVLQKDIELTESGYKEKISALEKKAQECWMANRRTESNTKGLQQEVEAMRAQFKEAVDELKETESKLGAKVQVPHPMMSRMPIFPPMFPPPPPMPLPGMFRPPDHDAGSLRSTPFSHVERPFGPSPAPVFRPLHENHSTSSTPGPRSVRLPPQSHQQQPPPTPLQSRRFDP